MATLKTSVFCDRVFDVVISDKKTRKPIERITRLAKGEAQTWAKTYTRFHPDCTVKVKQA